MLHHNINHSFEIENKHLEKLLLYGYRVSIERKGGWDRPIMATAVEVDTNDNEEFYSAEGLTVGEVSKKLHISVITGCKDKTET